MKTKMREKENASSEFDKIMNIDAFVSDYEFMYQMCNINMDISMQVVKKGGRRK
jgi:hypothetical protein